MREVRTKHGILIFSPFFIRLHLLLHHHSSLCQGDDVNGVGVDAQPFHTTSHDLSSSSTPVHLFSTPPPPHPPLSTFHYYSFSSSSPPLSTASPLSSAIFKLLCVPLMILRFIHISTLYSSSLHLLPLFPSLYLLFFYI